MRMESKVRAAIAALAALLLASAAQGATLCVNPLGGACQTTIQGGVNAANPGDIVKIAPGVYYENVNVPPGKDRIQIVGSSKVTTIVDPSPVADLAIGNSGPAFVIDSPNVQLKNLMIRNGQTDAVVVLQNGVLIQGLNVNGANGSGVVTVGWRTQILMNEFHNSSIGVVAVGYGHVVRSNLVTGSVQGIVVVADGSQVLTNRVYTGQLGVIVVADGAVVRQNDVRYQSALGMQVVGSYPTVQSNRIFGSQQGLFVQCTNCFGGSVSSNAITDTTVLGLIAVTDGPGLVVQSNNLLRATGGLSLNGIGITAQLNKVTDPGVNLVSRCVEVFGDLHTVARNTATRCASSGFYVNGNDNFLDKNQALGVFENGFLVDGDDGGGGFFQDATLTGNKTTGDAGAGFAVINGAVNTMLTGNAASKNRVDFCNDGTGTVYAGANLFPTIADTGGADCVILH